MKAYIVSPGDSSVGIPTLRYCAEIPDFDETDDEPDMRNISRRALAEAYLIMLNEPVTVHFDDECPDCTKPINLCRCEPEEERN